MFIFQSIILGIVQGITEFLPISSSAHLVIVPALFGWEYNGLSFDIALHFGTLFAIVLYFWKDWVNIIASAIDHKNNDDKLGYPPNLFWQLAIATIPAGIFGYLIADLVESKLHSLWLLAINLAVFGLVLYLVDRYTRTDKEIKDVKYKNSFFVGIFQAMALIPGVSRSGITMIGSRLVGLKRESAARFSFLLGTPAMVGAFLFDLKGISEIGLSWPLLFGFLSSMISGMVAIKFLLNWLKRADFSLFFYYRIGLALLLVGLLVFGILQKTS